PPRPTDKLLVTRNATQWPAGLGYFRPGPHRSALSARFLRSGKSMTAIMSKAELARAAAASECASLRAELEALRVELTQRRHAELTAIREALSERINEAIDQ